jgi:hypothetical protein
MTMLFARWLSLAGRRLSSTARCPLPARRCPLPARRCLLPAVCCLLLAAFATPARALTPESPEVREVIGKAIKFLEQAGADNAIDGRGYNKMFGAKALVGMCMLKWYGADEKGKVSDALHEQAKQHAKVVEAVAAVREGIANNVSAVGESEIYNVGIAMIFLFELDPHEYRTEMEALTKYLVAAQKPHGGWGYLNKQIGDTSMTQYGVLGLWAAANSEIETPLDSWERVSNWLMRSQDLGGGFAYQAEDPGGFARKQQQDVRMTLAPAALGSLGLCADYLRLFKQVKVDPNSSPLGGKLKRVPKEEDLPRTKNVEAGHFKDSWELGQKWMRTNNKLDASLQWLQYYLYAVERYQSVREYVLAESNDNQWYDDGFAILRDTQASNGSWKSQPFEHELADTAFGALFLLRSMRRSIERAKSFGGGTLVGGRGLPDNAAEVEMRLGTVRAKALKGPAMELLSKLNPDDPQFDQAVEGLEQQSLLDEDDNLSDVQKRLRALVKGQPPETRAAALRLLGRTRDLDNVPILIEALKDPDPGIFVAADDALRFMARKLRGAGYLGGTDDAMRKEIAKEWKAWYRAVRPDAQFDDG